MKTKLVLIAVLAFGPVALSAAEVRATPSLAAEETQKLEKFMVTGSLESPLEETTKLDKFMVTGSLESPQVDVTKLDKFMVTGSLESPQVDVTKLDKFMVTGSMASETSVKRRYANKR
jgi:hypothetical protein